MEVPIDIKLDTKNTKTLIQQVLEEVSLQPLKSYEKLITAEDDEGVHYEFYYKGQKINNVIKIVLDTRIESTYNTDYMNKEMNNDK